MNALQKYTKRINENIFDTVRRLFLFRSLAFPFWYQNNFIKKGQNASRGLFAYAKNVLS